MPQQFRELLTTQVILEPLDFIARLAALVPKPRVNLTRPRRVCSNSRFHDSGRSSWKSGHPLSTR